MRTIKNGQEIRVGDKVYRVIDDELFEKKDGSVTITTIETCPHCGSCLHCGNRPYMWWCQPAPAVPDYKITYSPNSIVV